MMEISEASPAIDADSRLVVLFAGPRSGSNYLGNLLGQVPGTVVLSEIFNAQGMFGLNLYPGIEAELIEQAGSHATLLRLFRMNPVAAMQLLGFKFQVQRLI